MLLIKSIKLHTLFAKTQDILNAVSRHMHIHTRVGGGERITQLLLLRTKRLPPGLLEARSEAALKTRELVFF